MLGLVLYMNIYGKEMLDSILNVSVSSDMNSFSLKAAEGARIPVLEYIHGMFVGLIRSLREPRRSKLLSYNMFFMYNEQSTPDLPTLTRDIQAYINTGPDGI